MFILESRSFFYPYSFYDSSHIPMLFSENYAEWKDKILLTLGYMDLDCDNEPPFPRILVHQMKRLLISGGSDLIA